jgi:hypothetical protein
VREIIEEKMFKVEYVGTDNMIADIMTKSLGAKKFERFRRKLGVW